MLTMDFESKLCKFYGGCVSQGSLFLLSSSTSQGPLFILSSSTIDKKLGIFEFKITINFEFIFEIFFVNFEFFVNGR